MRHRFVPVLVALLVGCGSIVGDPDANAPLFTVHVLSPTGGTFTVTQRNAYGAGGGPAGTLQGNGSFQEVIRTAFHGSLDTTLQEIRGSFTGPYLVVGFGSRLQGAGGSGNGPGAQSGSLQSLSGPDPQASPCQLKFGASEPGGSTYRVQFRLTAVGSSVCRQP